MSTTPPEKLPPVSTLPVSLTGGILPPVSLTPVANLPPVKTTLVKLVAKFAGGVVDTGGKFTTGGVVDTSGAPCLANISVNFRKNLKRPNGILGVVGKLIREKNLTTLRPFKNFDAKFYQPALEFSNNLWGLGTSVGIGLSYRSARLHRLAELISWNQFLGSLEV